MLQCCSIRSAGLKDSRQETEERGRAVSFHPRGNSGSGGPEGASQRQRIYFAEYNSSKKFPKRERAYNFSLPASFKVYIKNPVHLTTCLPSEINALPNRAPRRAGGWSSSS